MIWCHATSLTKFRHGSCSSNASCHKKTDNGRENDGRRGGKPKSNSSSSPSLNVLAGTRRLLDFHLHWQQCRFRTNRRNAPHNGFPPSLVTSTDNSPFCCFCSSKEHRIPEWSFIRPKLCATLIGMREASLPSISRIVRWDTFDMFGPLSPPKLVPTLTMWRLINASNMNAHTPLQNPTSDQICLKNVCNTAAFEKLKGKVKWR